MVIYTLILNIYNLMINIIISVKGIQKISDILYIRLFEFNKFNITREETGTR